MNKKVKALDYIMPYKWWLLAAIVTGIISAGLNVLVPAFISKISDVIQTQMFSGINLSKVWKIGATCLLFVVGGFIFSDIQNRIMVWVSQKFVSDVRTDLDAKLDKLPLRYYDQHQSGDLLSILTNDVNTLSQALINGFVGPILAGVTLIGCVVLMIRTNWIMAIGSIVSTLIGFFIVGFVMGKADPYIKRQQEVLGEMNSDVAESLNGFHVIKAYNNENNVKKAFHAKNDEMFKDNFRAQFANGILNPLMNFAGNLGYVTVCIIGAYLAFRENSGVTIASVIAFILYVRQFSTPLSVLVVPLSSLPPAFAAGKRIMHVLNEEETSGPENTDVVLPENIKGDVEFDHVRFGYVENRIVIHDFSAKIPAGSKVAIVGPTGAGKSTIINLIIGYYSLNGGKILLDGFDISMLSKNDLREKIALVPQDIWLFDASIKDNIKYMNASLSDEEVMRIIRLCGLEHYVEMLPDGMDTVLGSNASISAGHKQLMTIARAMAKDAPVLILDEATSNVDVRMEKIVQSAIDNLMEGRTSFVIAHRLSTIINADLILVIQGGDIVETGNHMELLDKKGFYYELYNSQFDDNT